MIALAVVACSAAPVVVRTDDEALRQILDNLIDNAIKYTPVDGEIKVRWKPDRGSALIEVIDKPGHRKAFCTGAVDRRNIIANWFSAIALSEYI